MLPALLQKVAIDSHQIHLNREFISMSITNSFLYSEPLSKSKLVEGRGSDATLDRCPPKHQLHWDGIISGSSSKINIIRGWAVVVKAAKIFSFYLFGSKPINGSDVPAYHWSGVQKSMGAILITPWRSHQHSDQPTNLTTRLIDDFWILNLARAPFTDGPSSPPTAHGGLGPDPVLWCRWLKNFNLLRR